MHKPFKMPFRLAAIASAAGLASSALAGGSPENILLVIDPSNAESMYLGHAYQSARNIPAANVLYIDPAAPNYTTFAGVNGNIDAVLGKIANSRITDHIDYIVLASGQNFYLDAPGLVSDVCSPVTRFSLTGSYASAFIRAQILAGGINSQLPNQFYQFTPLTFDSNNAYLGGSVSASASAKKYFICAQLGYTGPLGNTAADLISMINSAAASDGTHPVGTFYFMNTGDEFRNVRLPSFQGTVNQIVAAGGQAQILGGVLPDFHHDCLGIMTGWIDPNVDTSPLTLLPGSYCDNLTSWAGTFDNPAQTKMSAWIRRGAAGTSGTVEEPCNYLGKFAAPNLDFVYFKGTSLGEAWLRSMAYFPFQSMFQGDPMARPFATLPTVVGNVPGGTVSGTIAFTPTVSTTLPGAAIASVQVHVNGSLVATSGPGLAIQLPTTSLPDGPNEIRVLAFDNTTIKSAGRWAGTVNVSNNARSVSLGAPVTTGTLSTAFSTNISVAGPGTVSEVRLIQNGRVIASQFGAPAQFTVYGRNLGAGQTRVQAEALFSDGRTALSAPVLFNVAYTAGGPGGQAPVAYSCTKRVIRGQPFVVELPATYDNDTATYTLLSSPAQSTVGGGTKGYRIMTAAPLASGTDTFTFRVDTTSGQSLPGAVTLIYTIADCYVNCDSSTSPPILNANDFQCFLNKFAAQDPYANCDGSTAAPILNANDFQCFINQFAAGCS